MVLRGCSVVSFLLSQPMKWSWGRREPSDFTQRKSVLAETAQMISRVPSGTTDFRSTLWSSSHPPLGAILAHLAILLSGSTRTKASWSRLLAQRNLDEVSGELVGAVMVPQLYTRDLRSELDLAEA